MLIKSNLTTAFDFNAGAKGSLDLTYNEHLVFFFNFTKWLS